MTPEFALATLKALIPDYEQESATTVKTLDALPDSGADYRPDPKSRTALELSFHVGYGEKWFLEGCINGAFAEWKEEMPAGMKPSQVSAWYLKETDLILAKVKEMTGEQAAKIVDFMGAFQLPAVVFFTWAVKHTVHHRGQLTAYLRAAGGKVPAIYGGSADEEWKG